MIYYLAKLLSMFRILEGKGGVDTGKNKRFPFLDILGYLKNTHKNPKFGRVRQVPIRELGCEFPGWDLSHSAKFGIFMHRRTGNFWPGGAVNHLPKKNLTSCPNFYERVEKK